MLVVRIKEDEKGIKITAKGHTGYAEHGKDIVCAAASAVMQTAVIGFESLSKGSIIYKEKDGFLDILLLPVTGELKVKYEVILDTMLLGLIAIEKGYKAYVKVEDTRL